MIHINRYSVPIVKLLQKKMSILWSHSFDYAKTYVAFVYFYIINIQTFVLLFCVNNKNSVKSKYCFVFILEYTGTYVTFVTI